MITLRNQTMLNVWVQFNSKFLITIWNEAPMSMVHDTESSGKGNLDLLQFGHGADLNYSFVMKQTWICVAGGKSELHFDNGLNLNYFVDKNSGYDLLPKLEFKFGHGTNLHTEYSFLDTVCRIFI